MRAQIFFFSLVFAALPAAAATTHAAGATRALATLNVGDQGECHTVFVGRKIERVPFVVRGIMPDFLGPHRDLLLIRLLGERAEFSGVAAGMSGSPCLVDGKVVGALSYSFGHFNKEPLAGVTPIGDMLEVFDLPTAPTPWQPRGAHALLSPSLRPHAVQPVAGGHADLEDDGDWASFCAGAPSPLAARTDHTAQPIALALSMAGASPSVRQRWAPYLRSHGFGLTAGGSAAATPHSGTDPNRNADALGPLVPGDAVAAVLVAGDISMAGTGTVTWVDGNRLLAFGHPFMGLGAISAPMARSTILQILASSQHSQKMPVTGDIIGEFTEDRLFAIGGVMGPAPAMLPVRGKLRAFGKTHPFSFDVSLDAFWTPRFFTMALAGALAGQVESAARGTLRVDADIRVGSANGAQTTLPVHTVFAGERNEAMSIATALSVGQAVSTLWRAPQAWPLPALSVTIDAEFVPSVADERIVAVHAGDAVAQAGAETQVSIELAQFGRPNVFLPATIAVPRTTQTESLKLLACDHEGLDAWAEKLSGGPVPQTPTQAVEALRARHAPGAVYLQWVRDAGAMHASAAERFSELPVTASTLLAPPTAGASKTLGAFVGAEVALPRAGAVAGCAEVPVRIARTARTLPAFRPRR